MKNLLINRALAAKKKKIFTLFCFLLSATALFASVEVNGLYYILNSQDYTAKVTYKSGGNDALLLYNNGWNITTANIPSFISVNEKVYTVTSIGLYAFANCGSLTSVTIPNSITSIDGHAFQYCSALTSVTIPNSVTSIGYEAFENCTGLTSVTIGNSVTSIGSYAFYECSGLTSVTIPNSVTSIGDYAFHSCSGLTSVTIGNSVTSIGDYAFHGCKSLTSPVYNAHVFAYMPTSYSGAYTIPNGIESIAGSAFYGCSSLTSVTIPNSVTSIGDYAFYGCSGLTSVTIPNSVTSIGDYAFHSCSGLTSVTIGNSVTSIGDYAFWYCKSLTSVTIGNSVISIGDGAFGCTGLTSVTIGNSVTSIGKRAFLSCKSLTSVTIPNSVTSIGDHAFYGCSGLTSVTIGNSVTSIGQHAFWYCTGLTSVTIPNSVTSIGADAFYKCSGLTSVTIGNSVTSIGRQAFYGCSGLTSVTIGNSVTSIGDYAFHGCKSLTSPVYNAHVFAYMPTSYSGAYTIPNGIESIAGSAFYHCTGLTSVTIPNSVTSIEEGAFRECIGLTSVTIGNSVTCIGEKAFSSCSSLTSVTIPNSVTSIGNSAFAHCSRLNSVTIEAETPPTLGHILSEEQVFGNTNNCPIYVPCNAVNTYKTAPIWRLYAERIYVNPDCPNITVRLDPSSCSSWSTVRLWAWTDSGDLFDSWPGQVVGKDIDGWYSYTFDEDITSVNIIWNNGTDQTVNIDGVTSSTCYALNSTTGTTITARVVNCPNDVPAQYNIVFKNWDGSVLQSTQVEEGQMPQYTGATPTKPSDSQYSYTFSGWTPQIVAATADATYIATFTATKLPTEECGVNDTWLQTGGSGLGEMTTDNSGIWTYENRYGACAKANSGETGWLLTPAKDLRGMKSVNLSFLHVHKNAGTFTDEMTLWVCANYKGSVGASQWQQLTITPYSTNNDWGFVNVSIDVPLSMVGANTVFGFKYTSSNYSAKWQIKELNLNAECAKADETTTTDVTATPNEDNSVTLTWPAVNGADTYTIEIKKNGVSVCTLVFNANGQLISINFAAPARDGKGHNVPAAEQSANGWTYVVTGLEENASYTYSVTAKDVNGNVLLKQSVDFSMGEEPTSIEDVQGNNVQCTKVVRNGQILILRGDKTYTLQGQEVK